MWNIDDLREEKKKKKRPVRFDNVDRVASRAARSVTVDAPDQYEQERRKRFAADIPQGALRMSRIQARYLYGEEIECPKGSEGEIVWIKGERIVRVGDI